MSSSNTKHSNKDHSGAGLHDFELLKLSDYYMMIRKRWLLGLSCAVLVSCGVGYALLSQPAVYQSNAALLVERESERVVDMQQVVDTGLETNGGMWRVILENHVNQLQSRSFRDYVIESFTEEEQAQIVKPYLIDSASGKPRSIHSILAQTEVENVVNTFILQIRTLHRDPEVAAMIADRYVERYINFTRQRGQSGNEQAIKFLMNQADLLAKKVQQAEQELQEYRQKHNLVSVEGNQGVIAQRLNEINTNLTAVRMERIDLESRLRQVKSFEDNKGNLLELEVASLRSTPEILAELGQLRQERQVMSEKYLERHPKMVANQQSIAAAESRIQENIRLAIAELQSRLRNVQAREERLVAELEEAEQESLRMDRLTIQYAALNRKVEGARQTHSEIIDRLNETAVTSQLDGNNIRVVDKASLPSSPAEPSPLKVVLLMAVLGGFCFIGTPIGLAAFDKKLKSAQDVENFLGQNLIGEISVIRRVKRIERPHVVSMDLDDATGEAFRGMIGQLHLRPAPGSTRSIMLTSTLPDEGKSFVVSNLGSCFAAHGKRTVIVDFDLRRPALHQFYGRTNAFGILRWLEERHTLTGNQNEEALGIVEILPNLYLLCAGGQTKRATEAITDPSVGELIGALKSEFDVMLVDTPPLGVFPDALALAPLIDESLYVVHFGKVERQQVRNYVRRLDDASGNLLGVVMNGMPKGGTSAYYRSGYGYGHYKYAKYYAKRT